MDIDRARTYLEIVHTGSFLKASERLHVTQTTVSARVRTLEDELGRKLFIRNRNGAVLTAAGRDFERFAQSFLQVWERARQQLKVPAGKTSIIALGGELSLWNPVLLDWLLWMKQNRPEIAIRANVGLPDQLIEQLRTGVLDIAVLYAPPMLTGFKIELIEEEELVLVRTAQEPESDEEPHYVHVDWGPQFETSQASATLATDPNGLMVGLGPLGLSYILRAGGSGYFRKGAVTPHLEAGELELVAGAPRFTYPAYAVYAEASEPRAELRMALEGLKQTVQ